MFRKFLRRISNNFASRQPQASAMVASDCESEPSLSKIFQKSAQFLRTFKVKPNGQRILLASSVSGNTLVTTFDSLVAVALWLRGSEVAFLLCDKVLKACEFAEYKIRAHTAISDDFAPSQEHCNSCYNKKNNIYNYLPFRVFHYSEFITEIDRSQVLQLSRNLTIQECFSFVFQDKVLIGEQVRAGVIRYFGSSLLDEEDQNELITVTRSYLQSAYLTALATERLVQKFQPTRIVNHHGVYVPQGVIDDVARKHSIPVIVWGGAPRDRTFILSHGQTYHRTFLEESNKDWLNFEWNNKTRNRIDEYVKERMWGKGDWSWVTDVRGGTSNEIPLLETLGLDPFKPSYCLLTNIGWDAQLYYSHLAYPVMMDWIFDTIDFFSKHEDRQLIIRINPFEVKVGNREFASDHIKKRYAVLPKNIVIVDRDSKFNTYVLAKISKATLIYGTKTGFELAAMGVRVVIAGDSWMRNKGIAEEAATREDYISILEKLPTYPEINEERKEFAKRFAYYYFFRKMIPINSFKEKSGFPPLLEITSLDELLPGKDKGLDVICNGIIKLEKFEYDPL